MGRKRRYCIFAAQYFPHLGGVERYTYNLSKKLIENGNEVVVVTSNVYRLPEYERLDKIAVYRIPCYNLLKGRYPVIKFNRKFWKMHRVLKSLRFDMIIVNTRFYLHSLYGMLLAKSMRIPCITLDHGTSHLSVHNKFLDSIGAVFEHSLTKIETFICKDYYGVSGACNEWLAHFHIKAKGILYNSINPEDIRQIREKNSYSYRKEYQIAKDAVVIVFTGRLLEEKGVPNLLNVMERLHQEYKNIYLFIAGDGDLEADVNRHRSDYIIPLGRLELDRIIALLDDSDIFCLPSFSEGFSTSILEAAMCGCYIVTTARGGARELLIDDRYGCVIPNNEEDVLYDALKEVIEDKERRRIGTELTYERVKDNFTWDIVAEKVENIARRKCKKRTGNRIVKRGYNEKV